jgi:hypothetical protein
VTQEVTYNGQTSLSILLEEDTKVLSEVVVTALGITRESKSLGYAMTTISAGDLTKTGSPNFATALYGKASGVRIQNTQGVRQVVYPSTCAVCRPSTETHSRS